VAVGVFQPEHARLIDHEDAAIPKLEPRRTRELVVEDAALSRATRRCVDVVEDEQAITWLWIAGLPLRISRHARNPEPPFAVEVDLVRFCQRREFTLTRDELHLITLGNLHRRDAFLGCEILQLFRLGAS